MSTGTNYLTGLGQIDYSKRTSLNPKQQTTYPGPMNYFGGSAEYEQATLDSMPAAGGVGTDWLSKLTPSFMSGVGSGISNYWNDKNSMLGRDSLLGSVDPRTGKQSVGLLKGVGDAVAGIGGVYNAFQANDLARDSYNAQKDVMNVNIANQTKLANNEVADLARRTAVANRMDPTQTTALEQDYNNRYGLQARSV